MAQTGYTPIQLYRTTTAAAAPLAANLNAGELAINYNTADMSVWALNSGGSVIRLMNNPAGLKYPTVDGTANYVLKTDGAGTLSWVAQPTGTVTSVSGTAPVVSSGGATPAISMAAATTSVNGYLTSTDWTTFNGKYSTGGALGTPSSGTLSSCTVDGTNGVGYINIPQNSQSAAYTLVAADAGKHIFHPSTDANARTFTIPANGSVAYPIGTAISFVNMTAAVVSIAITTDTMYLAGTGTTGTRSLAQYGTATALKMTSTTWIISGAGLT
jgi:hypothetical protein